MRPDRVILQKSYSAGRLLRAAWTAGKESGAVAGYSVLAKAVRELTRPPKPRPPSRFDQQFGVDTGGIVRTASLDIESPNHKFARYYKATDPDALRATLSALKIDWQRFTFIDYGSGKGLALLVASMFPFRRILGVEFAADLHRIAERNIAVFRSSEQRCRDITSIHADATQWVPPEEPLVCFFYEPFDYPVFAKVIHTLEESYIRNPREIVLVYHQAPASSLLYEATLRTRQLIVGRCVFSLMQDATDSDFAIFTAGPERQSAGAVH